MRARRGEWVNQRSNNLERLRTSGVQQAHKADRISFTSITGRTGPYRAAEISELKRIAILKARMNADLQRVNGLKNTGTGNLFAIFGEPDIGIIDADSHRIHVQAYGVDAFQPKSDP